MLALLTHAFTLAAITGTDTHACSHTRARAPSHTHNPRTIQGLSRLHFHTTRMGMGGTIAWMAPEAIRCTYSKGGDVWSFGVVLWEMITRKKPFDGIAMATLAWLIASKEKTLPIPASCPRPLRNLLLQCWKIDHTGRPSFSRLIQMLREESMVHFGCTDRTSFVDLQEGQVTSASIETLNLNETCFTCPSFVVFGYAAFSSFFSLFLLFFGRLC